MSTEEFFVNKIENGIRSIKRGTKLPKDSKVAYSLNRLKNINDGLYIDLLNDYKNVVKEFHLKNLGLHLVKSN